MGIRPNFSVTYENNQDLLNQNKDTNLTELGKPDY